MEALWSTKAIVGCGKLVCVKGPEGFQAEIQVVDVISIGKTSA